MKNKQKTNKIQVKFLWINLKLNYDKNQKKINSICVDIILS